MLREIFVLVFASDQIRSLFVFEIIYIYFCIRAIRTCIWHYPLVSALFLSTRR